MSVYSWVAILTIVGISSTPFGLAKQPTSATNQPTVTGTMIKNGIEVACSGDPYCEAQPYTGKMPLYVSVRWGTLFSHFFFFLSPISECCPEGPDANLRSNEKQ